MSLVVIAAIYGLAFMYGSRIHAAHEVEKARAIDEESKEFCSRFGVGPETARYPECAGALVEIRKRHEERIASDSLGIL